jgi:pimeloyl-ACP methyl ester carboxylesterase
MKITSNPLLAFITIISMLSSCARLDDNLFNPNENKISEYKFDKYEGEVDFRLSDSYKIPASLITLLTLNSKAGNETSPVKLYAVYIGDISRIATDTVILYCHGNKDHMDFYWPRAELLANTGGKNRYGVMMMDYRGYGLSEGKPSEEGLYADVNEAMKWLQSNGLTGNRLVMYGFSMGTAPAVKLTAEPQSLVPSKLMLEAPMASAELMVQDASALALPGSFFTDLKIDNGEKIKKINQPFFWIHGIDDDFIDINQGELVYKNYKGVHREAHSSPNAGHSNVPNTFGFENYLQAVGNFIANH